MSKGLLIAKVWLWLLLAVAALLSPAVFADDVNLKQGGSTDTNDANLANMYSVRQDYFKRYPHAKMAEQMRGRKLDTTKTPKDSKYELPSNGVELTIPAGPLLNMQTDDPKKPDPYFTVRPLYRPLYAYCGGPGAFLPAPQPGMKGNFVPNYSQVARGQGGGVTLAPPVSPTCYVQPLQVMDNSKSMAQEGDQSIFEYELTTFGVGPISDTQLQMIDREDNQRFLELLFDPERWLWAGRAASILQQQQMATGMANGADYLAGTAYSTIKENLPNVANESAGSAVTGSPAHKTKNQVIGMVQRAYREIFIPMAILFLLPGAILTQMKGMVQGGLLGGSDPDSLTPFQGIVRAIIAVFLIPATQLIVSYMIDVGNSMSGEVKKWVDYDMILAYAAEQNFGPQRDMNLNVLAREPEPPQSESSTDQLTHSLGGDSTSIMSFIASLIGDDAPGEQLGKAYSAPESKTVEEKTPQLSKQVQLMYNTFEVGACQGLMILGTFQFVMMCYLYLMGPLAAAFYAWPTIKSSKGLFSKIFNNWLEAVIVLSLWRFWWNVVLACMTTYILWCKEEGFFYPSSDWEIMVFASFQVLLLAVPFAPFNFQAAPHIKELQEKAEKGVKEGGGDGGSGGGGGGGGGDGGSGRAGVAGSGGAHGDNASRHHTSSSPSHSSVSVSGSSGGSDSDSSSGSSGGSEILSESSGRDSYGPGSQSPPPSSPPPPPPTA